MTGHPAPRRRRRRALQVLLVVLVVVVVGLTVWVAISASTDGVEPVSLYSLVVAILALAGDLFVIARERDERVRPSATTLADELAAVLREEWYAEAKSRRLRDSRILPLTWKQTRLDVGDSVSSVVGRSVTRLRLDGRLESDFDDAVSQLAAAYRRIPSKRLVVLGEPGSGKSALALLLAYGLVDDRPADGAVPVLLSASTWDPLSESLDDWLVRSLARAYYRGRDELPRRLLEQDLILPIVDGLDEIPESSRRTAIRAVNQAIQGERPVVVTCRSVEYEDLIEGGAPVLRRAPVVEVQPVAPADLIHYFRTVDWPDGTEWERVVRHVADNAGQPVAQALSTPLMISLAVTVYRRLGAPAEAELDAFDSRHAVEDQLTDQIIDAAYAPEPSTTGVVAEKVDVADARRWLTFLAQYLHRYGERDFVWWRMSQRLLSPWLIMAISVGCGATFLVGTATWIALFDNRPVASLNTAILFGAGVGTAVTVLFLIVWFAVPARPPGQLSFTAAGSIGRLSGGFRSGVGLTAILGVTVLVGLALTVTVEGTWNRHNGEQYAEQVFGIAAIALVLGAGLAVHNWMHSPPRHASWTDPKGFLRQDRQSSIVGAIVSGGIVGLLTLPVLVAGVYTGSVLSKIGSRWSGFPGPYRWGLLLRAREADLTSRPFGPLVMMYVGAVAVLPAIVVALLLLMIRAWPRFVLVRLALRARGQLPWNLLGVLADARDRELIRQVAGAYQFRHIRLQERLADQVLGTGLAPRQSTPASARTRRRLTVAAVVVILAGVLAGARVSDDNSVMVLVGDYHLGPYSAWPSRSGHLVALTGPNDPDVHIWDLRSRTQLASLGPFDPLVGPRENNPDLSVQFTDDDRSAVVQPSGADAGFADIWRLGDGTATRQRHVTGSGTLAAGGTTIILDISDESTPSDSGVDLADRSVELWNSAGRIGRPLPGSAASFGTIDDRFLDGDDHLPPLFVLTDPTGRVGLRRADNGNAIGTTLQPVNSGQVTMSDEGVLFAGGSGTVDGRDGKVTRSFPEFDSIAFPSRGTEFAISFPADAGDPDAGDTVQVWNRPGGAVVSTLHTPAVDELGLGLHGSTVVVKTPEDTVEAWSSQPGKVKRLIAVDNPSDYYLDEVNSGKNGSYLITEDSSKIKEPSSEGPELTVSELGGARSKRVLKGVPQQQISDSIGADGRYLWAVDGIYDVVRGTRRFPFRDVTPASSFFSEEQRTVVNISQEGVQLLDLNRATVEDFTLPPGNNFTDLDTSAGGIVAQLSPCGDTVTMVPWLADRAVVESRPGSRSSGTGRSELIGHSGGIAEVKYLSNDVVATSGASDDSVRLWSVRPGVTEVTPKAPCPTDK